MESNDEWRWFEIKQTAAGQMSSEMCFLFVAAVAMCKAGVLFTAAVAMYKAGVLEESFVIVIIRQPFVKTFHNIVAPFYFTLLC